MSGMHIMIYIYIIYVNEIVMGIYRPRRFIIFSLRPGRLGQRAILW